MGDLEQLEAASSQLLVRFKALFDDETTPAHLSRYPWLVFVNPNHAGRVTEDELPQKLISLAGFIEKEVKNEDEFVINYLRVLADASRDIPILRSVFGLGRRPSATENDCQASAGTEPDCILELARRTIDQDATKWFIGLRKQALRIVANCCADNNINRSLIIGRSGIQSMRKLADRKEELEVLLPTVSNVCIDFDEPAIGSSGEQLQISEGLGDPSQPKPTLELSAADYALGSFDDVLKKTGAEVLLDLTSSTDPSQLSVLADLVEMSSRPALFGLEHITGTSDDPLVQPRVKSLFRSLTQQSSHHTVDEDARASICQAYLNILSQQASREFIAQSPTDLEACIRLPYLHSDGKDQYTEAFLKLVYAISALPTYIETATPDSEFIRNLAETLQDHNTPVLEPTLILIANSLTSVERIPQFHNLHPLQSSLPGILLSQNESTILLSTLSICTRLALVPQAQRDLFKSGILAAIKHLLTPVARGSSNVKQDQTLQIHRDSLVLTRLIIKSQASHAKSLLTDDAALLSLILDLSATTIDTSFKLEAGRLMVEILRTIFGQREPVSDGQLTVPAPEAADAVIPQALSHASLLTTPKAINAILSLLTDGPSPAIRAESLFGLGLLVSTLPAQSSSLPSSSSSSSSSPQENVRTTILQTLAQQKATILGIFEQIGAGSPATTDNNKEEIHGEVATTNTAGRVQVENENENEHDEIDVHTEDDTNTEAKAPRPASSSGNERRGQGGGRESHSGMNAELENLKFLLSLLLSAPPPPLPASTTSQRLNEESFDHITSQAEFLEALKMLARNLGLTFNKTS